MSEDGFTFAELAFLMSSSPGWADTTQLGAGESDAVRLAGMASLLVRGLARADGAEVVVTEEVAALTRLLGACTEKVSLAASTGDGKFSTSTFAFSPDRRVRMLNSTVAPGVVEVRPLRADVDLVGMLADISLSAVEQQAGVLALGMDDDVLQIQQEGGRWSWRTGEAGEWVDGSVSAIREQIADRFGPALEGASMAGARSLDGES